MNPDKKAILEKYFPKVTARHIDYANQPGAFKILMDLCENEKVDYIVGSSFGGYLGFYLSRQMQIPALVFNPALFFGDQDEVFVPEKPQDPSPFTLMIIGEKDHIIPPETTRKFLANNPVEDNLHYISISWLAHIIDLNTFEIMLQNSLNVDPGCRLACVTLLNADFA